MSASLLVDLQGGVQMGVSIVGTPVLSGALVHPCSGAIIGNGVSFNNANGLCNLFVAGYSASGQLRVQVQCSDSDTSGNYTDPTSGLAQLPGLFQSGGILWLNSGGAGTGILHAGQSGAHLASGFMVAQGFQRTGEFVRANLLSGDFGAGPLTIGFAEQRRETTSGFRYVTAPSSGAVAV